MTVQCAKCHKSILAGAAVIGEPCPPMVTCLAYCPACVEKVIKLGLDSQQWSDAARAKLGGWDAAYRMIGIA